MDSELLNSIQIWQSLNSLDEFILLLFGFVDNLAAFQVALAPILLL
jgi:hypothetical protein